jgi:uncharacterized repeat protein (TIGR02543 family)
MYQRNENYTNIVALSALGKQQRFIVIPDEIRGRTVGSMQRVRLFGGDPTDFRSEHLEKLFFQRKIFATGIRFEEDVNVKIFVINISEDYTGGVIMNLGLTNYIYANTPNAYWYHDMGDGRMTLAPANITYYLNFDTNVNRGVHWLDDIGDGEFIEFIPLDPVRTGYMFAGWFTEPETANKWCFETHKKSNEQLNLFAKWI